jgi:Fic family protein
MERSRGPNVLRLGRGLKPSPEQVRDRWIWQHPAWPAFSWDWERLVEPLGRARQALGRLQMAEQLLAPGVGQEVLAQVIALEGVSTSAIEGERINPESMAASVARHLGLPPPAGATLDRRAEGVASLLLDALRNPAKPLTVERLCRWHQALFPESRPDIAVGTLRPGSVQVESSASDTQFILHFLAVPREGLEAELQRFIGWFNAHERSLDGLVRAGIAHLWFLTLHPFDDGNGRIGRALADLALARDRAADPLAQVPGLLSSRILQVRPTYYAALQEAQSFAQGLEATPWLTWFLDQVTHASALTEGIIRRVLAKGAFWARHRETPINERQRKVLNRLLDAEPETFQGGITTRKYASLTHCSPITASRDLAGLAAAGLLKLHGAGRSTAYSLDWDDQPPS